MSSTPSWQFICYSILLLCPTFLLSQNISVETIAVEDGLSQGMIFDLLEGRDGFLWIGTREGLNRYDGKDFKVYKNDPFDSTTVSGNEISELFEDSKGRLWVGTAYNGLNLFNREEGNFIQITARHKAFHESENLRIRSIGEDKYGRILAGDSDRKFNIITLPDDYLKNPDQPIEIKRVDVSGLGWRREVEDIWTDKYGNTLATSRNFPCRFYPDRDTLERVAYEGELLKKPIFYENSGLWQLMDDPYFQEHPEAVRIIVDSLPQSIVGMAVATEPGTFWLMSSDDHNLHLIDVRSGKYERSKSFLIAEDSFNEFHQGKSGTIWIGTGGYGIRKVLIKPQYFEWLIRGQMIPDYAILSDSTYLITQSDYAWSQYFPDTEDIKYPMIKPFTSSKIGTDLVYPLKDESYWVRRRIQGDKQTTYITKFTAAGDPIRSLKVKRRYPAFYVRPPMLEDRQGQVWLIGVPGLLGFAPADVDTVLIYNYSDIPIDSVSKQRANTLYEDALGKIWIGLQTGMVRIDSIDKGQTSTPSIAFKWFRSKKGRLNTDVVSGFLDDPLQPKRYLWIATKGGGLNRYDRQAGTFEYLTTENGLPDNTVYAIMSDEAGNIWGSTNLGLFRLTLSGNPKQPGYNIRVFTTDDGLQDLEFNTNAYQKLPDGRLSFAGIRGLNIFDPKAIKDNDFNPSVFITNFKINNEVVTIKDSLGILEKAIEYTDRITLNHQQAIFSLTYAALDFTNPDKINYRYKLEGIDEDWIYAGTQRTANYNHLPSGKYTFVVNATNSSGKWSSQIRRLDITTLPPWWLSTYAYAGYFAGILLITGIIARFYSSQVRLKNKMLFEQKEAERIRSLDQLKSRLYTNITHELRTPLTIIQGMVDQIRNQPEKNVGQNIQLIESNGRRLLRLINQMLDLSKLENGKVEKKYVYGDLVSYVRNIVNSFQNWAERKQLDISIDTVQITLNTYFDPEKLQQILYNLISNAIKFTEEGGQVKVYLEKEQAHYLIKVKDTGIGIRAEQLPYIFDRFYQVDVSSTRKRGGTGIGLSLTKELVHLLEGQINFYSQIGVGTNAIVKLPIHLPEGEQVTSTKLLVDDFQKPVSFAAAKTLSHAKPDVEEAYHLLIVEDNEEVMDFLVSCFPNYKISQAFNGQEGIDKAKVEIPDLIISDVMMPIKDGFELCETLKNDNRTSHIPILMLTAKADNKSKISGLKIGADDYISKPFHLQELLLRVQNLIQVRKHLQDYYASFINSSPKLHIKNKDSKEHQFIIKVRNLVISEIDNYNLSVEQLAKQLYMSKSQLNRKLRGLLGKSIGEFIREVRLCNAKELLLQTDLSISQVALESGFQDPAYFGRIFKRTEDMSPSQWRKAHLQVNNGIA